MRFSGTVDERTKGEKGFVLAMTGLLIVPMLIFTAFAVDLGAWYGQGAKMQRAADAASLAGVVWLPDQTAAVNAANTALTKNGFSGLGTFSYPAGGRQMQVTITKPAAQYFSKIVLQSETLTRSATAEFNKPVPLGSPGGAVGNDVASCAQFQPTTSCGSQPMLWSAIQGPYETHANGDAFATLCKTGNSGSGTVASGGCGWTATTTSPGQISNPDYKPEGYEFAIDVPAAGVGQALNIQLWDAGEFGRTTGNNNTFDCNSSAAPWSGSFPSGFSSQQCQTGDSGPTDRNGVNMQFQLWDNDGSDLTTNFTAPISGCERFIPADTAANPTAISTYKNKWVSLCTFTPTRAGIYPLRVKSSNITRPASAGGAKIADTSSMAGWNAFSMKVTGTTTPKLYSIGDLSIWTNTPGSIARFYLANIGTEHKGKTIQLDLFDPGDGNSGTYSLQLLAPPGAAPFNTPAVGTPLLPPLYGRTIPATNVVDSCYANTSNTNGSSRGAGTLVNRSSTSCTVTTRDGSGQKFQNAWLRFEIKLSANYACTTDCWWTIKYNFGTGGLPNDRTTWAMTILGDPVHLTK